MDARTHPIYDPVSECAGRQSGPAANDPIADIRPLVIFGAMRDGSKSLQELEKADWGNATTAETPMIGRLLALRRKPLRDLTDAEVRLAVSQKVGFPYTLELAIDRLSSNPLVAGENYPGDVLAALLRVEEAEWVGRDALRARLIELYTRVMSLSGEDAEDFREAAGLPSIGSCPN